MTILKVIARTGLAITAIGILASSADTINYFRGIDIGFGGGYAIAEVFGFIGVLLALIGGIIGRPRYFWLASLIIGVIYLASFSGFIIHFKHPVLWQFLLDLSPGIVLLIEGIALWFIRPAQAMTQT